ncbi:MAG: nucleoside hydrolase [Opitutales bacterium]
MSSQAVSLILGTDMATDCDDAAAMAVMHGLADRGEARILAVVANNRHIDSVRAVHAINRWYGRPEIPLGTYRGTEVGFDDIKTYSNWIDDPAFGAMSTEEAEALPDAVTAYRQALAAEPDNSVTVVSIGHLNNIHDLLVSSPDAISPLTGSDLFAAKVNHAVIMGGGFPDSSERPQGWEHNFGARGAAPHTHAVLVDGLWPESVPITFVGVELGWPVKTGVHLNDAPDDHPVKAAFRHNYADSLNTGGRESWDLIAVLVAVRGPEPFYRLSEPGTVRVARDGSNTWAADPAGRQGFSNTP